MPPSVIDDAEALYAPPDHPVFKLVPPAFDKKANLLYSTLGHPPVSFDTFWTVYRALLAEFQGSVDDPDIAEALTSHETATRTIHEDDFMPVLPNQKPLRNGDKVVGEISIGPDDSNVAGPSSGSPLLQSGHEYADFTDEEDEEEPEEYEDGDGDEGEA